MTCREAREILPDLFDVGPAGGELRGHLACCPNCAAEYEALAAVMAAITPAARVEASVGFKQRVVSLAAVLERRPSRWFVQLAAVAALTVVAVVLLRPVTVPEAGPAASTQLLEQAAAAMSGVRSLHVSARMAAGSGFTPVEMWSRQGNDPQWRVETPSWAQWMASGTSTEYYKEAGVAFRRTHGTPLFRASALLEPNKNIQEEVEMARRGASTASVAELDRDGNPELLLTVRRKAGGSLPADLLAFENAAADQTRVYRFDPESRRLTGMQIVLHSQQGDAVVFEIEAIHYDEPVSPQILSPLLPADVVWAVRS